MGVDRARYLEFLIGGCEFGVARTIETKCLKVDPEVEGIGAKLVNFGLCNAQSGDFSEQAIFDRIIRVYFWVTSKN